PEGHPVRGLPRAGSDPPRGPPRRRARRRRGAVSAARLEDYREVAPRGAIHLLLRLGERLRGRRFVHVNGSRYGSGSSEILARLVPLFQDIGVDAPWEVIVGDPPVYPPTRTFPATPARHPP